MKKHLFQISVGFVLTLVVFAHAIGLLHLPFLQRLEFWTYDVRLNFTLPGGVDSRIVIVDIDEKSLAEQGQWPWSRNRVAKLVEALLDDYKASIVGFDVVFAEKDNSSGLEALDAFYRRELRGEGQFSQAYERFRGSLDYDAIMASTIKDKPIVLGYYFSSREGAKESRTSGLLPLPIFSGSQLKGVENDFFRMSGYGANIPLLQRNAMSAGHFNPATDVDGVARRVPLLIEYGGNYYESLSLAVVRGLLGKPDLVPGIPKTSGSSYKRLEWLALADMKIPVDDQATALIPYRGRQGSFPYVSATDLLNHRANTQLLYGAIVLVGTTAPGLMDLRSTPVMPVYAGVEIHANMIAGMLDNAIKHAPSYAKGAEIVILLVIGLLLSTLLPFLGPVHSFVSTGVLYALVIGGNMIAWERNLVLPLATILLLVTVIYVFNVSYAFFAETRAARQIRELFGQYVPPQIVSVMSRNPALFSMEAECRQMTVLFADIVNFTKISEEMEPRQLADLMNVYLSSMTAIIYEHGGTVDKYIGDAVMAFWGAPISDPEHARHGIKAALAMQRQMVELRRICQERGWPELKIGIGLNSGEMRVGNMGSRYRVAYTVIGDAVNLSARLESLTRRYNTWIIAGEQSLALVPDIPVRELDLVRVKGKNKPVAIFSPLEELSEYDKQLLILNEIHNRGLAAFRSRDWNLAEESFREVQTSCPEDPITRLYLERIESYRVVPPAEDWDGVFEFTTK